MKHIPPQRRPQQGYMLLESLISFVVVGVGILGATKLNTTILQSASASKARAEATALAQTAIENARNYALPGGCQTLQDGTVEIVGVNATFKIQTVFAERPEGAVPPNIQAQDIKVCVAWDKEDKDKAACTDPDMLLHSTITCTAPGTSAMVGDGGAANQIGGALAPPSGRAVVGGALIDGTNRDPNTISTDSGDVADGTKTRVGDAGIQLLDSATDKVLLTVKKLDCEANAPEFSTISGKVFIKTANNGNPSVPHSSLMVMPSDAGYCSIMPYDSNSTRKLPAGATGNNVKFYYTYYKCYVGAGWYGNIGDVLTSTAANTAGVCVGNPNASITSGRFNALPQLGNKRQYWGYGTRNSGYFSLGIGLKCTTDNCPSNNTCLDDSNYEAQHYTNHHFVVGGGISNDTECSTQETNINSYVRGTLNGSPGRQFCMTPSTDGRSCLESHLSSLGSTKPPPVLQP